MKKILLTGGLVVSLIFLIPLITNNPPVFGKPINTEIEYSTLPKVAELDSLKKEIFSNLEKVKKDKKNNKLIIKALEEKNKKLLHEIILLQRKNDSLLK
jgi:hypothetical protein